MNVLFVTPEAYPLIKTGGLGDVSGSLPLALAELGQDVTLFLPAYPLVKERIGELRKVAELRLVGSEGIAHILEGTLPGSRVRVWLFDCSAAFERAGHPYLSSDGSAWQDNAWRFTQFSRAAVELAQDRAGLGWRADLVHCHDWQTALVPALLTMELHRPATVFTIHNLSYQGLFGAESFKHLALPPALWGMHGLEFHGMLSIIKGGILYADMLTTVSPSYAQEIQWPEFGYGLDGLLQHRSEQLEGILNGVDEHDWNPADDHYLPHHYHAGDLSGKTACKLALQDELGLEKNLGIPVIGLVSRLVEQKGIDLVLGALPRLIHDKMQLVVLGSGDRHFEQELKQWAHWHPDKVKVVIGYDEGLSHRIEAGCDIFLMPSRFEPCGLNQLYSLRYGTIPMVRRVGGLADSVVHADETHLANHTATGIVIEHANDDAVVWGVEHALKLYRNKSVWKQLMQTAMKQDFSWKRSAQRYQEVYQRALQISSNR